MVAGFPSVRRYLSVLVILILSATTAQVARAETYVAGQVGATLPQNLSDIDFTGMAAGLTSSDLKLKESLMYGAKVGHYFESAKWLGIELEAFNSTPHVKQQDVTISAPGVGSASGNLTGATLRMTTVALNLVARYQAGQFEPYVGAGIGAFFAHLKETTPPGSSQSSMTPGLNTQVGLRYRITPQMAVFSEWKFNYTRLDFDETSSALGFKGTYQAHHFVFGVGYHF
jgi:opacity protein-like surface antigen